MKYKTIFWDFNGTIVDDVALGIASVNRMLAKRGLPLIESVDAYRRLFRFPVRDYYELLGFDFAKEPFEVLAVEWVDNYVSGEKSIPLTEGFPEIWEHFHNHGASQIIVSSSETAMLQRQLLHLGIDGKFNRVLGTDDIYAGGKIEMAKRCLGETSECALFIGDTPHDADTARAIGADCILYAGGHGAENALRGTGVPVISRLTDILNLL